MFKAVFKKNMLITILIAVLCASVVGISFVNSNNMTEGFVESGYVHVNASDNENKKVLFSAGAKYKSALGDKIKFKDTNEETISVSNESFIHYDDNSLAAFTDGVLVDVTELQDSESTMNHYSLPAGMKLTSSGDAYTAEGAGEKFEFTDFVWKLSENKYLVASKDVEASFGEDDERTCGTYAEVTYLDGSVIQIQTDENVWQTISNDCKLKLGDDYVVDLSMKNIQNKEGEVLVDFSRIVIDSNDNVELTPMSDEMESIAEKVIPHFTVNSSVGENGENGAAGTAGSIGQDGNPGNPGEQGVAGKSDVLTGDVLNFPVFTVSDWVVSSNSCSGKITIKDEDSMLVSNDGTLDGNIYLVDNDTGTNIYPDGNTTGIVDWKNNVNTETTFEFTGLQSDHSYLLNVSAPLQLDSSSEPYSRAFVSKTFWTDSMGVYMEKYANYTDSFQFIVNKTNSSIDNLSIYYNVYTYDISGTISLSFINTVTERSSYKLVSFDSGVKQTIIHAGVTDAGTAYYSPNTTYYVVMAYDTDGDTSNGFEDYSLQYLTVTTLKETARLSAPTLSANRNAYGFDITPGAVSDLQGGIVSYSYEFYNVDDFDDDGNLEDDATAVKTVTGNTKTSITVSLDGSSLIGGVAYRVRAVASFYNNESYVELKSNFSNEASISASQLPYVYFTQRGGFYEYKLSTDTTVQDNVTYYVATDCYTTVTPSEGDNPKSQGWYVKNDSNAYVLTTDTTVQDKTYYGNFKNYTAVESPSGSPQDQGWYIKSTNSTAWDSELASGNSTTSKFYDTICGTLHINPGSDGAKLMLDADHIPTVTIRCMDADSHYYYLEYDIITSSMTTTYGNKYLVGTVNSNGDISVDFRSESIVNSISATEVHSLQPNTTYEVIVKGDLTEDGSTATEENYTVGKCFIKTAQLTNLTVTTSFSKTNTGKTNAFKDARVAINPLASTVKDEDTINAYNRQKQTIDYILLEFYKGDQTDALASSYSTTRSGSTHVLDLELTRDNNWTYVTENYNTDTELYDEYPVVMYYDSTVPAYAEGVQAIEVTDTEGTYYVLAENGVPKDSVHFPNRSNSYVIKDAYNTTVITKNMITGSTTRSLNNLSVIDALFDCVLGTDTEGDATVTKGGLLLNKNLLGTTYYKAITDISNSTDYEGFTVYVSKVADYTATAEGQQDEPQYDISSKATANLYTNYFDLNSASVRSVYINFTKTVDNIVTASAFKSLKKTSSTATTSTPSTTTSTPSVLKATSSSSIAYQYTMQANISNTNKVIDSITYYVYDAPDFYNTTYPTLDSDADTGNMNRTIMDFIASGSNNSNGGDESMSILCNNTYSPSQTYTESLYEADYSGTYKNTWYTPVMVEGRELGKVTIDVDDTTIPTAVFYPYTKEQYKTLTGSKSAPSLDSSGNTIMYFNDSSDIDPYGHQYVFCWTANYSEGTKHYCYPFDAAVKVTTTSGDSTTSKLVPYYYYINKSTDSYDIEGGVWSTTNTDTGNYNHTYGKTAYMLIPHSFVQDVPKEEPVTYSLQWASGKDEVTNNDTITMRAYVSDDKNAVYCEETNKAKVYKLVGDGDYSTLTNETSAYVAVNNNNKGETTATTTMLTGTLDSTTGLYKNGSLYASQIVIDEDDKYNSNPDATDTLTDEAILVMPMQLYTNKYTSKQASIHDSSVTGNHYLTTDDDEIYDTDGTTLLYTFDGNWQFSGSKDNNSISDAKNAYIYKPLLTACFNSDDRTEDYATSYTDANTGRQSNVTLQLSPKMGTGEDSTKAIAYRVELSGPKEEIENACGVRITFIKYNPAEIEYLKGIYVLTEDTSRDTSKKYYTYDTSANEYNEVTSPSGNPYLNSYYENKTSEYFIAASGNAGDNTTYYEYDGSTNAYKVKAVASGSSVDGLYTCNANPSALGWREAKVAYVLTSDTTVKSGTTYYKIIDGVYTKVTPASDANPKELGYYVVGSTSMYLSTSESIDTSKTYYRHSTVDHSTYIDKFITNSSFGDIYSTDISGNSVYHQYYDNGGVDYIKLYFMISCEADISTANSEYGWKSFSGETDVCVSAKLLYESENAGYSYINTKNTKATTTNNWWKQGDTFGTFALKQYGFNSKTIGDYTCKTKNGSSVYYTFTDSTTTLADPAKSYSIKAGGSSSANKLKKFGSFLEMYTYLNTGESKVQLFTRSTRSWQKTTSYNQVVLSEYGNNVLLPVKLEEGGYTKVQIRTLAADAKSYEDGVTYDQEGVISLPVSSLSINYNSVSCDRNNATLSFGISGGEASAKYYLSVAVGSNKDAGATSGQTLVKFNNVSEDGVLKYIKVGEKGFASISSSKTAVNDFDQFKELEVVKELLDNNYLIEISSDTSIITLQGLDYTSYYTVQVWKFDNQDVTTYGFIKLKMIDSTNTRVDNIYSFMVPTQEKPAYDKTVTTYNQTAYNKKYLDYMITALPDESYYILDLYKYNSASTATDKYDYVTSLDVGVKSEINNEILIDVSGQYTGNDMDKYLHVYQAEDIEFGYDGEIDEDNNDNRVPKLSAKSTATENNTYYELNYGDQYRLQYRAYKIGTGPCFVEGYNTALDKDNLYKVFSFDGSTYTQKSDVTSNCYVKFTVPESQDTAGSLSSKMLVATSNTSLSRMKFTISPPSKYNTYSIRNNKYTCIMIVEHFTKDEDGNVTKTEYIDVTGNWGVETFTAGTALAFYVNTSHESGGVYVDNYNPGDIIHCFAYVYQDNITGTDDTISAAAAGTPSTAQEILGDLYTIRGSGSSVTAAEYNKLLNTTVSKNCRRYSYTSGTIKSSETSCSGVSITQPIQAGSTWKQYISINELQNPGAFKTLSYSSIVTYNSGNDTTGYTVKTKETSTTKTIDFTTSSTYVIEVDITSLMTSVINDAGSGDNSGMTEMLVTISLLDANSKNISIDGNNNFSVLLSGKSE